MEVVALWRYPVKSMQGERLQAVDLTPDGLAGDRTYGVVDLATGLVLTARREPQLLFASAATAAGGELVVTLPDGSVLRDDAELSAWIGRPVALRRAAPEVAGRYETFFDVDDEAHAEWFEWDGPAGPMHDSTRARVSLVSQATLRSWDERRFRANVLVSGDGEDALVGSTIAVGDALLEVTKQIDRCVMVTRPQPGGIDRDLDVLRTINAERASFLAVGALVATGGRVAVGDAVRVVSAPA